MSIKRLFARLMTTKHSKLESGQALAEYMPTIAGMMALSAVVAWVFTPSLTNSYCKVVDAFTDPPGVCDIEDDEGDTAESETPADDPETNPEHEEEEATCVVSLAGTDGSDPAEWSGEWTEGMTDTLVVEVSELDTPVTYSLSMSFPNDPDKETQVLASGEFSEPTTESFDIAYPEKGEWGEVSDDGSGTYNANVALTITDPCGAVDWNRWYAAEAVADLGIQITNDHEGGPNVTTDGEAVTYTMTVTNHGPRNADVVGEQGVLVNLPVPGDVTVSNVTASNGGECQEQGGEIACDLGAMAYLETVTITVETTVGHVVEACNLFGESTVTYPDDPNDANNRDDTDAACELLCEQNVTGFTLIRNNAESGAITDNMELTLAHDDEISVRADVSGDVGSVKFYVNGSHEQTENVAPYAIAGDSSGNYNAWDVGPGTYNVQAVPYTGGNGGGETCSQYAVDLTIVREEAPETPGGIDDPTQPYSEDDPTSDCPSSHPTMIAEFDHMAVAGNPYLALQWGNSSRQRKEHTFTLDGDWDTVLVMRGAVGHPEEGCPEDDHRYCGWENQDNEHWAVDVDGEQVAFNPDNYAHDHVYMIYPDAELGVLSAGEHELVMRHAGLLDMPTNSYGPSVGAWLAVCVSTAE